MQSLSIPEDAMNNTCLEFRNLTLGYQGHAAVHHLSGDVQRSSLTSVVGANGSGKSTLLKSIAAILRPISGACVHSFQRLAYLSHQSVLDRTFPARVIDLVSLGFWQKRGLLGRLTSADKVRLSARRRFPVSELACHVPGCPPRATVILVMQGTETDVTEDDVTHGFSAASHPD
jgi:zinc/manganese transport system ATP-binding protein